MLSYEDAERTALIMEQEIARNDELCFCLFQSATVAGLGGREVLLLKMWIFHMQFLT